LFRLSLFSRYYHYLFYNFEKKNVNILFFQIYHIVHNITYTLTIYIYCIRGKFQMWPIWNAREAAYYQVLVRLLIFGVFHRNPFANGQTAVAKVRAVPHIRTPHRGVAHGPETGRRNPTATFRDQSDSRWVFFCNVLRMYRTGIIFINKNNMVLLCSGRASSGLLSRCYRPRGTRSAISRRVVIVHVILLLSVHRDLCSTYILHACARSNTYNRTDQVHCT